MATKKSAITKIKPIRDSVKSLREKNENIELKLLEQSEELERKSDKNIRLLVSPHISFQDRFQQN